MTLRTNHRWVPGKAGLSLLATGIILTLGGCAFPVPWAGNGHTGANSTHTVRYESCASARSLQRDLSLHGVYQGVEQLYIRWDGKPCQLATEVQ